MTEFVHNRTGSLTQSRVNEIANLNESVEGTALSPDTEVAGPKDKNLFLALDHWLTGTQQQSIPAYRREASVMQPICQVHGVQFFVSTDLAAVADIWRSFQTVAACTPFQNFDWLNQSLSQQAKDKKVEPCILFAYQGGRLRMIAPLAIERSAGCFRLIWLGQGLNDYNAPLVEAGWLRNLKPDHAIEIWQQAISSIPRIDYHAFVSQPKFIDGVANPFALHQAKPFSCNAYFLELGADWPGHYRSLRSAKSRRRLKDKFNKLKKVGRLRVRQIRSIRAKLDLIDTIVRWKSAQLDAIGARNPFAHGDIEQYIKGVAGNASSDRFLRIYALEVGSDIVAASIVLVEGQSMNLLIPAYDHEVFKNCSTGTILLTKLLELATRAGLKRFDFSAGDESYKLEWSGQKLDLTYSVKGRTAYGRILASIVSTGIELKRMIKSSAFMMRVLQNGNYALAQIKGRPEQMPPSEPPSHSGGLAQPQNLQQTETVG